MRPFANPGAFRAAIEARLRNYARAAGVPVMAVRRQASLERLIVRLTVVAPGRWALKGGLALDTKLGAHARSSLDMDMDHREGAAAARADLELAVTRDLDDYFTFIIAGRREIREGGINLADRYRVECVVSGTQFETFQVDVTNVPPTQWEVVEATRPGLLADVGLGPITVLLVPLERQVAEKLHAYTRPYESGNSTRVKDLVDFVLICTFERLDGDRLRATIADTFNRRATHPVPGRVPRPPAEWAVAYRDEALAVSIPPDLDTAYSLVAAWLDPILAGVARGSWNPERATWGDVASSQT
jgi:hypothetical protein